MKKTAFMSLIFITLKLFTQDADYLENVKKIKEQGLPDPDYSVSFSDNEWTPEKLDAFVEEAVGRANKKEWREEEKAFIAKIESAPKKLEFEGSEAEFHPEFLANSRAALGIVSSVEVPVAEKTVLKTCEESGRFTRQFRQTLEITLQPQPKKVKRCDGHQKINKANVKGLTNKKERQKIADKKIDEIKNSLETDSNITNNYSVKKSKDIHKTHIDIMINFQHIDDAIACDHSHEAEIPGTIAEKEEWKTDGPEEYARIANSPYCKLILIDDEEEGDREREIDGKKVPREAWARTLHFQCSPVTNSPCAQLEQQGGQLVKKRCLQRNEETGDCEFWEKTYDIGKRMASHTKVAFEEGKEIWGLNWNEIDPDSMKWDKQSDFPKVRTMMKLISDMPLGEGANIFNLDEKTPIFNGTTHKCNCHLIDELWDCCEDIKALWPAHCDQEELELREMRDAGRCHRVGSYHNKVPGVKMRVSKTSVFCCYPTELLKIFNEQARKRMGLSWGKPKKPNCTGFSLEQMDGNIHLDTMDFLDPCADLQIDETAITNEMAEKLRASLEDPVLKNFFLKDSDAHQ